jgi:hypothetical protein
MIIYTALVITDWSTFVWVYKDEPTREQVIQKLFEWEGVATLDWYGKNVSVSIEKTNLI